MYNISEFTNINTKKKKGKYLYCCNCGKYGHQYKECKKPTTSYGIIAISISSDNFDIIKKVIDDQKNNDLNIEVIENDKYNIVKEKGIRYENKDDMKLFCKYKNNIRFLMIRRKHTLGYIEFVRGRYNIDDIEGIVSLFKQMIPEEIQRIKKSTFDDLWNELWANNKNKINHKNEYTQSKQKFEKLSNNDLHDTLLNLNFYIENVIPAWNYAEWGFPKGRRNIQEADLDCAIREFKEESGFDDSEFILLDKIMPLDETFIGTNGIQYKHIYYLAVSTTNRMPTIDPNEKNQADEIGDIKWFTYEEAMDVIRPHHKSRKQLLTMTYIHIINTIISTNL